MAILPLQLSRVSNQLRMNVATQQLARTQQSLLTAQNELASGKRLNSPSDDPGASAIAQQLRKTLEQREGFAENLRQASSQLSEVDSTLSDLTDLIQQAQTIASANVGSDVTPEQRESAAAVVKSIYARALSIANRQFEGAYLFGGQRATELPFVEEGGGVRFVGSELVLANTVEQGAKLEFQVDGAEVFGALSSRVHGTADLTPAMSLTTRLADLRGTSGAGVRLGSILLGNGTTSATIDLSDADTIGDVINAINAASVGTVSASIAPDGVSLQLSGGGGENVSVKEVGGGTTAADLGILNVSGAGAGTPIDGASVAPRVTPLTLLVALNGGAGIDLTGLKIANGLLNATVDLSGAATVEDMLNLINGAGTAVRAQINSVGTGIDILNPTQGTSLTIGENGGATAADLGVRSFATTTQLSELNGGRGVGTVAGNDIQITDSNGTVVPIDLSGLSTVQDVIDAINAAASVASAGISAGFAGVGNGITITDTAGGAGVLALSALNFSTAAVDLGLTTPVAAGVISGGDVNPADATGVFAHLARLQGALQTSDQRAITESAEGLQADYDRVVRIRGQTGARVQEITARQDRLEEQNIATKALLSSVEDTDFTETIARFQMLQTSLQAALQTAGRALDLSLLDFLR
ncbi:MAG: flagellin hook IN motif-containing protein [Tepidisphaeraceae bacterium]